jgi:hypothetical protein
MGSAILELPEATLDPQEARAINDAAKEVIRYHPVTFDPSKVAIVNLGAVLVGIVGTRVIAYRARMRKERTARLGDTVTVVAAAPPPPVNGRPAAAAPAGGPWAARTPSELWDQPGTLPPGYAPAF